MSTPSHPSTALLITSRSFVAPGAIVIRSLNASSLDAFLAAPDALVFGIRLDGRLDCAAFVFDADYEPRGWTLILFLFRMVRVVGLRTIPSIAKALGDARRSHQRAFPPEPPMTSI
mgnify:CR=1 FL=1